MRWLFRLLAITAAGLVLFLLWLPDVTLLLHQNPDHTALMELREKEAREHARKLKSQLEWRPLSQISPNLMHAVLLSEDDTFYQHHGFDLEQIQIAIQRDLEKGKFVYGGSTITQQLARTLYLSPHKNLLRKAAEAAITMQLERYLPKRRILEIYLNVIEWGPGIYGAEAASRYYFSKGADALTPDEAVSLASILPSPRKWSPMSEKAFMARRRTQLTERMQRAGYWPAEAVPENPQETPAPYDPDALSGDSHVPPQPAF